MQKGKQKMDKIRQSKIVNDIGPRKFFEIASTMLSVVWELCYMIVMVVAYAVRSFVSLH